jgi:transcriptional regulator with XRE-family HTH domain
MGFNSRLKELREAAGLTQEALARKAGLSTSGVAKLENAGLDPAWSTVVKLAGALDVPVDAFKDQAGEGGQADAPAPDHPAEGKPKRRRGKKK